ncbi:MAG TPA: hypothetical protein PKH14_04500 [Syntrophorhabdus sp.]|nr:hypothetical protein [Syntrophorhabdus sp.]
MPVKTVHLPDELGKQFDELVPEGVRTKVLIRLVEILLNKANSSTSQEGNNLIMELIKNPGSFTLSTAQMNSKKVR